MYRIEIMYPNKPGSTFNFKHWNEVHLPMGLRLLKKHCGVSPFKVEACRNPYAPPGLTAPYHLINSLYFHTRDEADAFIRLFGIEEAARELMEDWRNYTQSDPQVMISELIECDPVTGRAR
ncbi:MAG TPA: EthD family reductase [Candidatus Binataceae bacterium]|nr:EthD family reductase [Candidatus Binataceae bacterium]HTY55530.1 EthD family reductase [Candidatus Binataceae bacterium]